MRASIGPKVIFISTWNDSEKYQMEAQLTEYHIKKIQKQQQENCNDTLLVKENEAKRTLMELDELDCRKDLFHTNAMDEDWSHSLSIQQREFAKPTIDRSKDKQVLPQKITMMTLAEPLQKSLFRNLNPNTIGMQCANIKNCPISSITAIPHLKSLLQRLQSPRKKRNHNIRNKQDKFLSVASMKSKGGIKIHFGHETQSNKILKIQDGYQKEVGKRQKTINIERGNQKVSTLGRQENFEWKNDSATQQVHRFFNQKNTDSINQRTVTSKQNRSVSNYQRVNKRIYSYKTNQPQNIPNFAYNPSKGFAFGQTEPLSDNSSNGRKMAIFDYEKIKRKYPSTYQIDVAYQKDTLQKMMRGTSKDLYDQSRPLPLRKKNALIEKFTLAHLLQ